MDRDKIIDNAVSQIERQYGIGSIMKLGEAGALEGIESISTSSFELDTALGIGGIPRGRVSEIFGPEASGKTTLALHIVANAQKSGGIAAFIDADHIDPRPHSWWLIDRQLAVEETGIDEKERFTY